jgi:hypothetical protein
VALAGEPLREAGHGRCGFAQQGGRRPALSGVRSWESGTGIEGRG